MALKFLDATATYSDPATSGKKVLDGTAAWAKPDSGRKALDATAKWSVPEIAKPGMDTPANVLELAKAARTNPTGIYNQFKDVLTPAISFGSHGSVRFRLVGCMHDDLASGGKAALSLLAETMLADTSAFNADYPYANMDSGKGYAELGVTLQAFLASLHSSMDGEWGALAVEVSKDCGNPPLTTFSKVDGAIWIPSFYELGITNKVFEVENPGNYTWSNEGGAYDYFSDVVDTPSDKRYAGNNFEAYWTRTTVVMGTPLLGDQNNYPTAMMSELGADDVNVSSYNANTTKYGVRIGFCVA